MKFDKIMLKNMTDYSQVGIYSIAARISEFWYFIPMIITQTIFPAIINSKKRGNALFLSRLQSLQDYMTFISLVIAILITFTSNIIISNLFGLEFYEAGKVLSVHVWAGIFVFHSVTRSRWIIVENYQKKALVFIISGVALNILFNLYFVPLWGALGAAIATTLSYSLSSILPGIFIKEFRIPLKMFFKSFWNIISGNIFKRNNYKFIFADDTDK